MDESTARLDAAWRDYAARIMAAGERITSEGYPEDPRLRAEGYRYVSRLTHLAHQIYVEFGDPERPSLFRYGDDTMPFGATNTDNNYYRAVLDPAGTYRISGDVRGVKELLFSVQDGEFIFGKTDVLAELSLEELSVGADGLLELFLGGPERPSNWLPLAPDAEYLNVREFVGDWEHDALASLYMERIDEVGPPATLTPAAHAAALDRAARWVEMSVEIWKDYAAGLRSVVPVNELQAPLKPVGGAQNMLHGAGQWNLGPSQALLVEFERPAVTYWSIQTYVLDWMVPLDFANRVTSLNDRQLHEDEDGVVRIVLGHADPGVQNWLDTSGLDNGLFTYRYVRPTHAPAPRTSVIDAGAVRSHLPASTPSFSSQDRAAQIDRRRRGVTRRFRR
jgi:hypothetical protein